MFWLYTQFLFLKWHDFVSSKNVHEDLTNHKIKICILFNTWWVHFGFVVAGEDPRLHGLYHNCGYNAAGTMLGGGCGDQLAQWIVHGRPDLHMFDYDIR